MSGIPKRLGKIIGSRELIIGFIKKEVIGETDKISFNGAKHAEKQHNYLANGEYTEDIHNQEFK